MLAASVHDCTFTPLTGPEANAFFPAAALDYRGRLHVVWYDTAGDSGVLRYAHSRGAAPFADGFIDPIEIDPDATPGNGWYPGPQTDNGERRLREYIGLAVDEDLVHIAWTHSPHPPSRVYAVTVRPE